MEYLTEEELEEQEDFLRKAANHPVGLEEEADFIRDFPAYKTIDAEKIFKPVKPLFDDLVAKRLGKALAICTERGTQYGDTMRNAQWLKLRAVAETLGITLSVEEARKLAIAGLCDVKYQRFEGGFKADNLDDGINYDAFLAELMES